MDAVVEGDMNNVQHVYRRGLPALLVCALGLVTQERPVQAADFPERVELARRSEAEGVGRDQLPVLERQAGPGRREVLLDLERRLRQAPPGLAPTGIGRERAKNDRITLVGDDWYLKVLGDGTAVRFRNYAALDGKASLAVPVSRRMDNPTLEALGRRFIADFLGELVLLDEGESLLPLFTEHQISGGGPTAEGAPREEEKVMASTVVFGRAVASVAVIGPGSKIAVLFANDGTPVGFDYDWPRYERAGTEQRVLPLGPLKERARGLARAPLDSPEVVNRRFECGYFDPGARRGSASPIEAGCSNQYVHRRRVSKHGDAASGYVTAAYADHVPAGERQRSDRGRTASSEAEEGETAP